MLDRDLPALSDPAKDQYFLTNPAKLQYILDAADIRESDVVVEIGAGAGTVARALPRCANLTLIELDPRLMPALRSNAPDYATVLNTDGVALLRSNQLRPDVILGNLPNRIAMELAMLLPKRSFRVAVLTTASVDIFEQLSSDLDYFVLTSISGDDFTPYQPGTSFLVALAPRK